MYRVLLPLLCMACTVSPINTTEKQPEDSPYPDGYTLGDLVIDPGTLDFGNVAIDDTLTEELLFINTSSAPISVVSASIDGDSVFSLESSYLSFDIDGGAEEIVNVRFTPIAEDSYEASLSVLISTESSPGEVVLLGNSGDVTSEPESGEPSDTPTEAGLEFNKSSHDYGQISLNSTATFIVDVSNDSDDPITITGISSTNSAFSVSPYSNVQEGEAISAGITRTMTINFLPTEEIAYSGTLTLETDSDATPSVDIDLEGEGVYQCQVCAPKLQVNGLGSNPLTVDTFKIGLDLNTFMTYPNPSIVPFTISNGGDEPLEITSITLANDTSAPDTILCGTDGMFDMPTLGTPLTLAPYDTLNNIADTTVFDLTYTYSGSSFVCGENSLLSPSTLTITSNDPTNPTFVVNLEATVFLSF